MGEFNSDEDYVYYCGQEYHRRNGIVLINKVSEMQYLGATLNNKIISFFFQGKNSTSQKTKSMLKPPLSKKLKLINSIKT